MKVKPLLLLLCILCTFCACREDSQMSQRFLEIDELTNTHPDSALTILNSMRTSVKSYSRPVRMKYELLYAKAQNRAYVDFTTDSVMLEVCDYYDHHGSPNERMLAHYLLGCTYRDLGEAPRTLECYKDAISCADTLSPDCDYRTMMSICGQMATLYDKQAMPLEEIEASNKACKYALACGDTLGYIRSIEVQAGAYNILQDTMRLYEAAYYARELFLKHGMQEQAARTLLLPIANKLSNKKFKEARNLMNIYEEQSGLFDDNGNLPPRYNHYNIHRANYYLGTNNIDSAELYFRKSFHDGYIREASRGLLNVYNAKKDIDSVTHYSTMYIDGIDQEFTNITKESLRQTEAMYDYSRNQQIAHEETIKRKHKDMILIVISFIFIIVIVLCTHYYQQSKVKKRKIIKKMADEYLTLSTQLEINQKELELSKQNFAEFEIQKCLEQQALNQRIQLLQENINSLNNDGKKQVLVSSSIVADFKQMVKPQKGMRTKQPTSDQWTQLEISVKQATFYIYNKLVSSKLSEQELRVAILTYLDFAGEEIAMLLESSSQRVSNAKRSANKKVFGKEESKSFKSNLNSL